MSVQEIDKNFESEMVQRKVDLLTPAYFYSSFLSDVESVGDGGRVWVQSMRMMSSLDRDKPEVLDELIDPLINASKRGVNVIVGVSDGVQKNFPDGVIDKRDTFLLRRHDQERTVFLEEQHRANEAALKDLESGGVIVARLKSPGIPSRFMPIASQVHSKFALVDTGRNDNSRFTSYLMEFNLNRLDMVSENIALRIQEQNESHPIYDTMFNYARGIYFGINVSDYSVAIDSDTTFLADAGRPGRSVIFGNARRMVRESRENIKWFSQYPPAPPFILDLLASVKRGVSVEVLLSENCSDGIDAWLFKKINRKGDISVRYLPKTDHNGIVHSKLLVADNKALFTSNNLHPAGLPGTGEIGMLFQDPSIVTKLNGYHNCVWNRAQ